MAIIHILPEIDSAVWKALDAKPKAKVKGQRPGTQRGPQPKNNVVPDETIRAIRRMHEIDRKPMHVVIAAYPQFSRHYVRAVLGYVIRATLKP